jgi:hypothetical protein
MLLENGVANVHECYFSLYCIGGSVFLFILVIIILHKVCFSTWKSSAKNSFWPSHNTVPLTFSHMCVWWGCLQPNCIAQRVPQATHFSPANGGGIFLWNTGFESLTMMTVEEYSLFQCEAVCSSEEVKWDYEGSQNGNQKQAGGKRGSCLAHSWIMKKDICSSKMFGFLLGSGTETVIFLWDIGINLQDHTMSQSKSQPHSLWFVKSLFSFALGFKLIS